MTYHIFSVRQGHVFWREVLSLLVIRVFEFGTLCGLEENFFTKCNSVQYQRHFRSFVAYCQDLKVFPKAQIFLPHSVFILLNRLYSTKPVLHLHILGFP